MKLLPPFTRLLLLTFLLSICLSCASKKDIVFFQGATLQAIPIQAYTATLQANDLLLINVSAMDMESVLPFNLPVISYSAIPGAAAGQAKQQDYLIALDGTVTFPVLGNIALAGKTKAAAAQFLEEKLRAYVKNPLVTLRIVNYKVSVLGEVKKPGVFTIANERVSILEALGLAGDLTIHGQRKNILLIREKDGKKFFTRLDITATDFISSAHFYLQQNDVLYVSPNKARVNAASAGPATSVWISVSSLIITIIALIVR